MARQELRKYSWKVHLDNAKEVFINGHKVEEDKNNFDHVIDLYLWVERLGRSHIQYFSDYGQNITKESKSTPAVLRRRPEKCCKFAYSSCHAYIKQVHSLQSHFWSPFWHVLNLNIWMHSE